MGSCDRKACSQTWEWAPSCGGRWPKSSFGNPSMLEQLVSHLRRQKHSSGWVYFQIYLNSYFYCIYDAGNSMAGILSCIAALEDNLSGRYTIDHTDLFWYGDDSHGKDSHDASTLVRLQFLRVVYHFNPRWQRILGPHKVRFWPMTLQHFISNNLTAIAYLTDSEYPTLLPWIIY